MGPFPPETSAGLGGLAGALEQWEVQNLSNAARELPPTLLVPGEHLLLSDWLQLRNMLSSFLLVAPDLKMAVGRP